MRFVSDFADQAVILPLVIAIFLALAAQGWWRGAAAWIATIAATFGAMLVLKVGFIACAHGYYIHSPSGHVAAATMVAGGLALLLLRRPPSVLPLAVLAAVVVGISRILLREHSFSEVMIGAMVGLVGATGLLWSAGPVPDKLNVKYVAVVAIIVVAVMHGLHLPAEAHISHLALRVRGAVCPAG